MMVSVRPKMTYKPRINLQLCEIIATHHSWVTRLSPLLAVIFITDLSVAVNMVGSSTAEQDVLTVHRKSS
jgi:hypothetical protein